MSPKLGLQYPVLCFVRSVLSNASRVHINPSKTFTSWWHKTKIQKQAKHNPPKLDAGSLLAPMTEKGLEMLLHLSRTKYPVFNPKKDEYQSNNFAVSRQRKGRTLFPPSFGALDECVFPAVERETIPCLSRVSKVRRDVDSHVFRLRIKQQWKNV